MPIQSIDLLYSGPTNFPEVVIDGTFDDIRTNDNNGLGGSYLVSYVFSDTDVFLTNNGLIASSVTTTGNNASLLINSATGTIGGGAPTGTGDVSGQIRMTGTGSHLLANFGEIIADIQFGSGQDGIYNSALIDGDVRMGGGDDYFVNDSATDFISDLTGFVAGMVNMGSGDDVVLNAGQMGRVVLGSGNDSYSVINPGDSGGNYNTTLATAGRVNGGTGEDTLLGGSSDDLFYGDNDNDYLAGHNGNDVLHGGQGRDFLHGGNQNDSLYGGDSKDRLDGGNHDDLLDGGSGRDLLTGGRGDDMITGGSGADTFIFTGNSDADIITDFDATTDLVLLDNMGTLFDGIYVSAYSDADVLSHLTYSDGNAVLDVSGLYNGVTGPNGFSDADGISITFLDVADGSLTGANFNKDYDDFLAPLVMDVA